LPQEARRICKQMKRWIECNVSLEAAQACRITYTGSVSDDNAANYASLVDGFVVGRAGLDAKRLERILQALALAATQK
jgi:triosephosphate isomerase